MTAASPETQHPAVLILGPRAAGMAMRVMTALPGSELWAPEAAAGEGDVVFASPAAALRELFRGGRPIVGICAAGILIRSLAPLLQAKGEEPPVIAVAEDGSAVVPLLGGHRGANAIARRIAAALGVGAAVTTASDTAFGVALDSPPPGWRLAAPDRHGAFMAALLEQRACRLTVEAGAADWLTAGGLPIREDARLELLVTHRAVPDAPDRLVLHPPVLAVGVGAERNAPPEALAGLVEAGLAEAGLAPEAVACVVSIDLKADEPAMHALAERLGVPARFFTGQALLAQTERLSERSEIVFRETGCWGVAEGAALAAAGPGGRLLVPKRRGNRVTCAIALSADQIDPQTVGRPRGRLAIVGIGPGAALQRSHAAEAALRTARHLVGYSAYLELVGNLAEGKALHPYPLGQEEARCRAALELAAGGEAVALVCSGDPGIYAMAALVGELLDREGRAAWRRIAIEVVPGVSAMQAAAAMVGAPLGHDFCAISLSDLMTPWEVIEKRLTAAAVSDFVVALYNPVSARRREGLARARDVLLRHRGPETPVVVGRNLGRPGQTCRVVPLGELLVEDADMLTVLIVGSRATRSFDLPSGRELVYTPRGYILP